MSANVAVIYSGTELRMVAEAFAEAADHQSARVRLLRVPGEQSQDADAVHPDATFEDLEWADGIAFGTPIGDGQPSATLMSFIEQTEPLWASAKLFDKVVSVFTDEPEHFAPDTVVHPAYEALYHWGAVIIGPRAFELAYDAEAGRRDAPVEGGLSGSRRRTAHYRGRRLAALAGTLSSERARRERLEL